MKKNRRDYPGSDSYMLETSSALQALFLDSLSSFTALDSTLDAAYAANWKAKIDAAYTVVQHSQVKDIAAQKTEDVLAIMEKCRLKYNEVKFFIGKAFKDYIRKQEQFGIDTYQKVRSKNAEMITFMDEMHKAATTYETELLAAGMSAQSIIEIKMLRDNLLIANTEQERYFKETRVMTQERIDVLNACYASTRIVIDAAMIVYYNDYARRNNYVYLPSSTDKNDIEYVSQAVLDETPIHIYTVEYAEQRSFVLINSGPGAVFFFIAPNAADITNKILVTAGERIPVKTIDLGTEGNNLYVKLSPDSGSFADIEVEISLEQI